MKFPFRLTGSSLADSGASCTKNAAQCDTHTSEAHRWAFAHLTPPDAAAGLSGCFVQRLWLGCRTDAAYGLQYVRETAATAHTAPAPGALAAPHPPLLPCCPQRWNHWGTTLTAQVLMDMATAMANSPLKAALAAAAGTDDVRLSRHDRLALPVASRKKMKRSNMVSIHGPCG